jgi:hypothetical protein
MAATAQPYAHTHRSCQPHTVAFCLSAIGCILQPMKFELEAHHRNVPDEELLEDIRRTASKLGRITITTREYNSNGKYTAGTVIERFGGWNTALQQAGLSIGMYKNTPDDELFENIQDVWLKLGRQPKYRDMQIPLSKHSASVYLTRFGTWREALQQFVTYVNSEEVETVVSIVAKHEVSSRHKTKRNINWRLRFLVMRRDNFKCIACGRSPATNPEVILHVDHVTAWDKGGETVYENLQALCSVCNIGKSNLDFKAE